MAKIINTYETVGNYCTEWLQKTLSKYAEHGFKLVSTMMAKNRYGVDVMYLFFTKEEAEAKLKELESE